MNTYVLEDLFEESSTYLEYLTSTPSISFWDSLWESLIMFEKKEDKSKIPVTYLESIFSEVIPQHTEKIRKLINDTSLNEIQRLNSLLSLLYISLIQKVISEKDPNYQIGNIYAYFTPRNTICNIKFEQMIKFQKKDEIKSTLEKYIKDFIQNKLKMEKNELIDWLVIDYNSISIATPNIC